MAEMIAPLHLRVRGKIDAATERLALRAALTASHLLGLATGTHLRELRGHDEPLLRLQARVEDAELRARLAWEALETLRARFDKIPERHRPYFTPASASVSSRSRASSPGTPKRRPASFSSASTSSTGRRPPTPRSTQSAPP